MNTVKQIDFLDPDDEIYLAPFDPYDWRDPRWEEYIRRKNKEYQEAQKGKIDYERH